MLVLTRRRGEAICICDGVKVLVADVSGQTVRIAVEAPPAIAVDREEVRGRKQASRAAARELQFLQPWLAPTA